MTLYLYVEISNFQKVIVLNFDEMNLKEKVAYLCFDRKKSGKKKYFWTTFSCSRAHYKKNQVNLFKLRLYFLTYFKLVTV